MWQPIEIAPTDGGYFFAIGDEEMAIVWWEPEAGMRWKIRNVPGDAIRLGDFINVFFHSWCRFDDLHASINRDLHPEYYLPGSEVVAREKQGTDSRVHKDKMRRLGGRY